ncbi:uncharacterized protein LOC127639555 [Xyrauchen texanus]|uniref:uncharacterized protein LOC127639555 n=1 Tax=Xyrauchen texanus TaxID=154827 RepID=UPI002242B6D5|nr:uncharacterized protein LOC127639555 [Xyrauchen texanus]XP_051977583.1 uncharacterized protein LOC127639555 [Xyrauchen texanus]
MLEMARHSGKAVVLGGDMRADSPGHCAKYGSYTMMNLEDNKMVDIQLIQSNEVGASPRMESKGFLRSLQFLESAGLRVGAIVTDRHPSIQKYLREQRPEIQHYFDTWHVSKGEEAVEKWKSVTNHVQNVHHHNSDLFPVCAHPPLEMRAWLTPNYVESLLRLFFEEVVINPGPYQEQINELKVPDHLCAAFDKPDLQESEVRPWSRFTQME